MKDKPQEPWPDWRLRQSWQGKLEPVTCCESEHLHERINRLNYSHQTGKWPLGAWKNTAGDCGLYIFRISLHVNFVCV